MPSAFSTDLVKLARIELMRGGLGKSKGHAYACQSENVKRWNGKGNGAEFFEPSPCSPHCQALRAAIETAENERK